jgi:uncharacterized protein YbjT (DUF2867 family)
VRVAVAGGTGLVGGHVVSALERTGHEAVILSRRHGIDLASGDGLDDGLAGAAAVVDVLNSPTATDADAESFFGTTTANLLAAEARAGVGHHVLLSIVNVDRMAGNAHYAGKRRQEALVRDGSIPWTIVRAAQFFEFAEMAAAWTRDGDTSIVSPILVRPLAAADAGDVLAEVAVGEPAGQFDLVGPEPHDLVDLTCRVLDARGVRLHLVPSWDEGPFGLECAGNAMLPDDGARIAPTRADDWLRSVAPA